MRENTNPDQIYVGDFKGMATSGGTFAATPEYLQSLTNAYVTKDGTIKPRNGSRALYYTTNTDYTELFQFSFANSEWLIHRTGTSFSVYKILTVSNEQLNISTLSVKTGVLRNESANEPATYAVKTDGEYCHVLIATKSTQLISLTLSRREAMVTGVAGNTTTMTIGRWYTFSLNGNNTKVIINNTIETNVASLSSSTTSNTVTINWMAVPSAVVVGAKVTIMSCFWLRFADASYYPGNQLYNTTLRRNTVPLDVNVPVPESLSTNYIYNEPIQSLSVPTLAVYNSTALNAPLLQKISSRNPTTVNTWDFSDGGYRPGNNNQTNRTPNYIAFGALETNNINSRIGIARLREVLVGNFEYPNVTELALRVDKSPETPRFFGANGTDAPVGAGSAARFFAFTSSGVLGTFTPGVNLDAVVELVYLFRAAGATAKDDIVNISPDSDRHEIGDGYCIPLYGYNLLANTKSFSFPSVVRFVGNRMVLTGNNNNRILISASDWNFRGFTFNNCQVSSLDFNENSPFLFRVDQTGATVTNVESANGVMIVFTENGIYRITGKSRNEPPNAITANSSKLSNQKAALNCAVVVDNTVYFANRNGLYKVNYLAENDDGFITELSLPVSNLFENVPTTVSYSDILESIVIKLTGQNKLLRFSLLTRTWSYLHVAVPSQLELFQTIDGYMFQSSTTQMVCAWSRLTILDNEATFTVPFTPPANTATVTTTPLLTPTLVSPPELMQRYAAAGTTVVPAYGGRVRAVNSSSVVTESNGTSHQRSILSSAVTKSIYTDKLTRSLRLRNISVVMKGAGAVDVVVTGVNDNSSLGKASRHEISVDVDGRYQVRASNEKNHSGYPKGDTVVVRLSDLGISEAFNVGFAFTANTEIVGFALDTSAKGNSKLT